FCQPDQPGLGGACDATGNCKSANDWCDPVAHICVDRWCFGSLVTPYKGCCTFSTGGHSCHFDDGGSCLMQGENAGANPAACCAGTATSGTCDSPQIFDP